MTTPLIAETAHKAGTREWHEARRTGIGGSDMAAILGLNPYRTAHEVYLEKIGEAPERETTLAMEIGSELEDFLVRKYAERTGTNPQRPNCHYRHGADKFMLANPDRVILDLNPACPHPAGLLGGLETKISQLSGRWTPDDWGPDGSDQFPVTHYVQVQHYTYVLGIPWMDLAALLSGPEVRVYRVDADNEFHAMMLDRARSFWADVEARRPPPLDYKHSSAIELVKRMYPTVEGDTIEIPEMAGPLVEEYDDLGKRIKSLTEQRDAIKANLLHMMGEAPEGRVEGTDYTLCRRLQKRREYTVAATEFVVFTVKKPKLAKV